MWKLLLLVLVYCVASSLSRSVRQTCDIESKVCHKTEKSCNEVTSCYGGKWLSPIECLSYSISICADTLINYYISAPKNIGLLSKNCIDWNIYFLIELFTSWESDKLLSWKEKKHIVLNCHRHHQLQYTLQCSKILFSFSRVNLDT